MPQTYNLYCDESCHLEHDRQSAMVLGAVWCPLELARTIALDISALKRRHGIAPSTEVKWVKVSPAKVGFYLDLIDYFFDSPELHFRALVIPDKSKLRHDAFGQDHDLWYYKMYFSMIKAFSAPTSLPHLPRHQGHPIRRQGGKAPGRALQQPLRLLPKHRGACPKRSGRMRSLAPTLRRSHRRGLLRQQGLGNEPAKVRLVRRIQERSGYSLVKTTCSGKPNSTSSSGAPRSPSMNPPWLPPIGFCKRGSCRGLRHAVQHFLDQLSG